jgi:L-ascorbate metabolism protein UlaG (beta-lactamase superfamily)
VLGVLLNDVSALDLAKCAILVNDLSMAKLIACILIVVLVASGCAWTLWSGSNPYYQGAKNKHFDGLRFFNAATYPKKLGDLIKWRFTRTPKPWPKEISFQEFDIPPNRVIGSHIRVSFVGQSTVLIQTANLNILSDPTWAQRASPFSWIGPKRLPKPGIHWKDLPQIDLVLISHTHYDHFDLETLGRLLARDNPQFFVGLGVDTVLLDEYPRARTTAFDWGDSKRINKDISVSFHPMQHWSARGLSDRNKTLWGAFLIKTPGGNIYFAGDAGYSKAFTETAAQAEEIRLAILPIGAYEPRWFMRYGHMNPEEAVQAHLDLDAQQSLGIHWGTFPLADEGFNQPATELGEALRDKAIAGDAFRAMKPGEVWQTPKIVDEKG